MGSRTRFLRFDPGSPRCHHDRWEEVYLISGDLIVGNARGVRAARPSRPRPMRAARPEFITACSSQKHALPDVLRPHADDVGPRADRCRGPNAIASRALVPTGCLFSNAAMSSSVQVYRPPVELILGHLMPWLGSSGRIPILTAKRISSRMTRSRCSPVDGVALAAIIRSICWRWRVARRYRHVDGPGLGGPALSGRAPPPPIGVPRGLRLMLITLVSPQTTVDSPRSPAAVPLVIIAASVFEIPGQFLTKPIGSDSPTG
jgi:hypothetical protein